MKNSKKIIKEKSAADDTIWRINGYRVRKVGEHKPFMGQKVIEVSNGKWWYVSPKGIDSMKKE